MIIQILEWLWNKGGLPLLIAAGGIVFGLIKDKQCRKEHNARIKEAKASSLIFLSLLRRHGSRARMTSLPDDAELEDNSGIIDVLDKLQTKAKKELDSDIEQILQAYLNENGIPTPPEVPKAKR